MPATPPPLPAPSDWDVLSTRIAVRALAALNSAFWFYTFPFVYAHADPKGDGFDMLPVMPFIAIFLTLTLPAAIKGFKGGGLGVALALVLGATILNAVIFLAVLSSYAATAN